MFSIELDKHMVKKNNRPIWRGRVGKSKELIGAENYLIASFMQQAKAQEIFKAINEPIWLIMHFYFTKEAYYTKQSGYLERSKKLPDLSNLYEIVQDTLQSANVIANDNLIESHDLSRRLVGPKTKLEVFILRYVDNG